MGIQTNRPTGVINPYQNLIKGAWIAAAVCVALPLILTPFGGDVAMVAWIIGGALAATGALTAFISMSMAKKSQRAIDALLAGEAPAHWTCSADEWAAFIEQDLTRGHKNYGYLT